MVGSHVHPSVSWPPASFSSCSADLADSRRQVRTAGMKQMAACVSPGPRLAACRRTKIASFFSEQNCCDGSFEGGVGGTCACGDREGGLVRSGLRAKSRSSSFPLRAA